MDEGDGETPSFDAVYREHFAFVYGCLLRLGVPPASVDDAAQDVFVTVHRRLGGFEGRSSVRSWLFGIVRRIAFRHRRTAQRIEARTRAFASDPPSAADGPVESLEHRQRGALLLRALDGLDDDKRAALTLHVFEEMPGPELASALGINVDTAYSRIKAARRELVRALAQTGVADDEAAWVDRTRRATKPDAAARDRVAGLVALRIGTAGGSVAAAGAGAVGKAVAVGSSKGVVAAIVVGATVALGIGVGERVADRGESTRAVPAVAQVDIEGAPPRPTAGVVPAELRPPVAEVPLVDAPAITRSETGAPTEGPRSRTAMDAAAAPAPTVAEPPSVDALAAALAAEVELITGAKQALDAGDPERALARLADHARRFADGQLASERAGYRAIALCDAGKTAAGRGEARVFVAEHPASSLVGRVRRACEISSRER